MTLVAIDPTSAVAISDYLTKARDWLATAVEQTGPEQIAMAKAEIATAAEATKQLGLSKEIQDDASEMVRRAEYALRKAASRAQERGEMASRQSNLIPGARTRSLGDPSSSDSTPLPSAKDLFNGQTEYDDANAMGALGEEQFEEVLADARSEGNLSRANVARKAREAKGKPARATRRAPLPDFARAAANDLLRIAERLERIAADDRFSENRESINALTGGPLNRSIELVVAFRDALRNDEAAS